MSQRRQAPAAADGGYHDSKDGKMIRREKRKRVHLNDHVDVLAEVLRRLDGHSLGVAACVCRLWRGLARLDSVWEHVCFRHVTPPPSASLRPVVSALGGYRHLYVVCLRPLLNRLAARSHPPPALWNPDQVQLSLSLFCVDYYERLCLGSRLGEPPSATVAASSSPSSSLMFLSEPVNVV